MHVAYRPFPKGMAVAAARKVQTKAASAPQGGDLGPIVSSAHLASGLMPSLSELEFGLILLGNAFNRWMVRCAAAAGVADLSALEVLVLHRSEEHTSELQS